jgi:formate dehydrogenase maturation protein FdhE
MNLVSSHDYATLGGGCCPNCNSSDLESRSTEHRDYDALNYVTCLSCGGTWEEVMEVTGYQNFQPRQTHDEE